jgi:hypothetical protein
MGYSIAFFAKLKPWQRLVLLLLAAYAFRLFFGLCSEFWFDDEKQVYLLGLKFYSTGNWPFFGPDVIYTQSQIPGALQALLVGLPFYLLPIPEAPFIFLNLLSLASLSFLAWYCTKRTPDVPGWFIWSWLLTAPWTLNYSTQVLNSSYVLTGGVLFFIGAMESYPFLSKKLIPTGWANFMMGFSFFWVFQLHLSWIILVPFLLASVYFQLRDFGRRTFLSLFGFISGALLSGSLAIPTFLKYGLKMGTGGTGLNVRFHPANLLEFFTVLARYLSLASFEISRFIGADNAGRLDFFKGNPWVTPFALFAGLVGIIQPILMLFLWFYKKDTGKDWRGIKYFSLITLILVYLSFSFSVKGPSSHAFYVVLPVVMVYSFYCWGIFFKKKIWRTVATLLIISGLIVHACLAISKGPGRSLYKDRSIPKLAIEKKDYHLLGERRPFSLY